MKREPVVERQSRKENVCGIRTEAMTASDAGGKAKIVSQSESLVRSLMKHVGTAAVKETVSKDRLDACCRSAYWREATGPSSWTP